jgi:GLPGLI family protein
MGQKIALSAEGAERPFEPIIEELEETKKIAGFECKKARYEIADEKGGESTVFEIYYTEAIDGAANTQFPGINGFPMEYVMEAQGMVITYTATKVTEEKVSKDLSKVPSGYEEMSYEDFVKMMGG